MTRKGPPNYPLRNLVDGIAEKSKATQAKVKGGWKNFLDTPCADLVPIRRRDYHQNSHDPKQRRHSNGADFRAGVATVLGSTKESSRRGPCLQPPPSPSPSMRLPRGSSSGNDFEGMASDSRYNIRSQHFREAYVTPIALPASSIPLSAPASPTYSRSTSTSTFSYAASTPGRSSQYYRQTYCDQGYRTPERPVRLQSPRPARPPPVPSPRQSNSGYSTTTSSQRYTTPRAHHSSSRYTPDLMMSVGAAPPSRTTTPKLYNRSTSRHRRVTDPGEYHPPWNHQQQQINLSRTPSSRPGPGLSAEPSSASSAYSVHTTVSNSGRRTSRTTRDARDEDRTWGMGDRYSHGYSSNRYQDDDDGYYSGPDQHRSEPSIRSWVPSPDAAAA